MRVYVAGPYTKGDVAVNVRNAINAGIELIDAGHAPFIPHLTHFIHMLHPRDYETWMRVDCEWLLLCEAAVVLPGESAGAVREMAALRQRGVPIFSSVQEFLSESATDHRESLGDA